MNISTKSSKLDLSGSDESMTLLEFNQDHPIQLRNTHAHKAIS